MYSAVLKCVVVVGVAFACLQTPPPPAAVLMLGSQGVPWHRLGSCLANAADSAAAAAGGCRRLATCCDAAGPICLCSYGCVCPSQVGAQRCCRRAACNREEELICCREPPPCRHTITLTVRFLPLCCSHSVQQVVSEGYAALPTGIPCLARRNSGLPHASPPSHPPVPPGGCSPPYTHTCMPASSHT